MATSFVVSMFVSDSWKDMIVSILFDGISLFIPWVAIINFDGFCKIEAIISSSICLAILSALLFIFFINENLMIKYLFI